MSVEKPGYQPPVPLELPDEAEEYIIFGEAPSGPLTGKRDVQITGLGMKELDPNDGAPIKGRVDTLPERVTFAQALRHPHIREIAREVREQGKHLAAEYGINTVTLWIGHYPKEVAAGAVAVGATIAGTVIGGRYIYRKLRKR